MPRVLLAVDDPTRREAVRAALAALDIAPVEVKAGGAVGPALRAALARGHRYDLLLVDGADADAVPAARAVAPDLPALYVGGAPAPDALAAPRVSWIAGGETISPGALFRAALALAAQNDPEDWSDARVKDALTATDVGVWQWDIENDRLHGDANLARLFGYPGPLGGPIGVYLARIHPEDRGRTEAAIAHVVHHGGFYEQEYRVVLPDGQVRWLHARGRVARDSEGRPLASPGVVVDITARRTAESALRASETRYRDLIEALDMGYCELAVRFDADERPVDYRFLEVNARFERHTGLHGALGRTIGELLPVPDPFWLETYGRVALGGERVRFERFVPRRGRWFEVYAQRVGPPEERRVAVLLDDITARKEAEAALRDSQSRLARLFETNLLGILYFELDGPVSHANDAFLQIIGYSREDLREGRVDWVALTPEEYRASDAVAVEALRTTGVHAPIEKEYVRKDGTRVWILVGSAMLDAVRGVGFVLDITERKRTEEALRASEARTRAVAEEAERERRLLDAVLDAAPVGIIVAAEQGRIVRMNRANAALWGDAPFSDSVDRYGEWKGWWADGSERDGERIAGEDWAMSRALRGEAAPGDVVAIEPWGSPPGTRRWMINSGAPVRDASGAVVGAIVAQMDITERVRTEQRLRDREERLRYALAATRAVTFSYDLATGTWFRSETSRAVLGLPERGPADEFEAIVHPDEREALRAAVDHAMAHETRMHTTFRIVHPVSGAVRWMTAQAEVQRAPDGPMLRMSGILTDVTERRLAEEQAQAAQRQEALGRLAGGVAHEINNALSAVLGFAGLALRRLAPGDPVRAQVEQIQRAGDNAAKVTRQLLAFGRKQVLQARDVDLGEVVRAFQPMLRQALGGDKRLVLACTPEPAVAHVDPGQIEQVLLNLALNARDAMAYGGRLEIAVDVLDPSVPPPFPDVGPGSWVSLTVTDDGAGMDAATRARLFEPFFTTKPMGKGTGLGLATVYGIVKQSKGHIRVASTPGAGTSFRILLPRVERAATSLRAAAPTPAARLDRRARVLVVDDDDIVRDILVQILETEGFDVAGAGSVAEAVARLDAADGPWDLVISDLVMPGESGAAMATHLRARSLGTPLLFVSGFTGDEAVRRGLLPGDAPLLQKPFAIDTLLAEIGALLRKPGA